ncbi:hypothetical protein VTL71DRAFT_14454 [Oculimacula yallundae]|uniref:Uncharacterized protein n=1 Tax=Oculimacula yallundae TaxID=86028 RepID=A0ABR4CJ51_9HELO
MRLLRILSSSDTTKFLIKEQVIAAELVEKADALVAAAERSTAMAQTLNG